MITSQIKAQVEAVLRARQLEDAAYRAVLAITQATELEEADHLVIEHQRLSRATRLAEFMLANMTIKAVEAVTM